MSCFLETTVFIQVSVACPLIGIGSGNCLVGVCRYRGIRPVESSVSMDLADSMPGSRMDRDFAVGRISFGSMRILEQLCTISHSQYFTHPSGFFDHRFKKIHLVGLCLPLGSPGGRNEPNIAPFFSHSSIDHCSHVADSVFDWRNLTLYQTKIQSLKTGLKPMGHFFGLWVYFLVFGTFSCTGPPFSIRLFSILIQNQPQNLLTGFLITVTLIHTSI